MEKSTGGTDLADSGLKNIGQSTLVFKAFPHAVLSPGYPISIWVPLSCCAHIELKRSARTAA
jgi:hypothetical protein